MLLASTLMFLSLSGIYEPSAIQQLPDGRFVVVEDEKEHPLSLVMVGGDGRVGSRPLTLAAAEPGRAPLKLNDLEGLALDGAGFVYAITSHSRDSAGEEKKSRQRLVRFRVAGERAIDVGVVTDLRPALVAAHPVLAAAAAVVDVKAGGGFNIEAIEITPDQQLLIGFRSPLLGQRAIVARVENPAAMFEAGAPPRVAAALEVLDLGGDGLRGMAHVPALGGYLLIAGPVGREVRQFTLWFWRGPGSGPCRRVTVPGLQGFEHAEGVSPAIIDGQPRIIIVSDDGSRADGRFARYLLLAPEQLRIAP